MAEDIPASILAQLFSGHFIIPEEKGNLKPLVVTTENVNSKEDLIKDDMSRFKWYSGNNRRNVAVIVADKQNIFTDDKQLQFLTSILNACRFEMADIALVNIAAGSKSLADIATELQPRQMILFGIKPELAQLPFTIPEFQLQNHNNCTYLFAPELNDLITTSAAAKEKKTKLWQSLRKMFGI